MKITTKVLLTQVKELIATGYNPTQYLSLWLVNDEVATLKADSEAIQLYEYKRAA